MALEIEEKDINKFILIGDRVLIKPKTQKDKTKSGLYLPPGVHEKEKVHLGYVLKTGPGYPIPAVTEIDEAWKPHDEEVKYIPLQPQPGDQAVYIQSSAFEFIFKDEKYFIVPHSAILMLLRDDELYG